MDLKDKESLDRLRRLHSGEHLGSVYSAVKGTRRYEEQRDWLVVGMLYLAEHPADEDEPVTNEWLESAGFFWDHWLLQPSENPASLALNVGHDLRIGYDDDEKFRLRVLDRGRYEWDDLDTQPINGTRGSLRRLCAVLGITLNEKAV